uniref:Uncharacterized protein n=1 Tax=Anopheles atroparvus TaxID=41427 RepID=A0A182JHZ6_ANOAO
MIQHMAVTSVSSTGLRNLSLSIKPPWVRRGQEAQLHCQYEMEGAPLYSVKWYRGTLEFYRYSPFENPPAKIFPFTGIKVDPLLPKSSYIVLLMALDIVTVSSRTVGAILTAIWLRSSTPRDSAIVQPTPEV